MSCSINFKVISTLEMGEEIRGVKPFFITSGFQTFGFWDFQSVFRKHKTRDTSFKAEVRQTKLQHSLMTAQLITTEYYIPPIRNIYLQGVTLTIFLLSKKSQGRNLSVCTTSNEENQCYFWWTIHGTVYACRWPWTDFKRQKITILTLTKSKTETQFNTDNKYPFWPN